MEKVFPLEATTVSGEVVTALIFSSTLDGGE
jgi:hypothetical protein